MPKCKVCGSRVPAGADSCPMCGAKIAGAAAEAQRQAPPTAQPAQPSGSAYGQQQPRQPQQPPKPAQPESPQPAPRRPSSQNPAELVAAVSYLVGQNGKIRAAADRIMDTYRIQAESTTNKKQGGSNYNILAVARVIAETANSWENVIYDIENTRAYVNNHQFDDGTYQSAVSDFNQSVRVAEQGIRTMRKVCAGSELFFPIMLVVTIGLAMWAWTVSPLLALFIVCMLIGPTIVSIFVTLPAGKNKKRLDKLLQRIGSRE